MRYSNYFISSSFTPLSKTNQAYLISYVLFVPLNLINFEPNSYFDAINSPNANKWLYVMHQELNYLYKNRTWILIKKPKDNKLLGSKWLLKINHGI